MQELRDAMTAILREDRPMTVRQVFYRMVGTGLIDKTENEYKNTVVRLLAEMRRAREIPFGWISDNTRWQLRPTTFSSLENMLREGARSYRRAVWNDQPEYVEVWLEKDALSGVLYDVTAEFDVPLMVTRGYPSISYLHSAAEFMEGVEKPVYIYYFGDRDPSGLDIARSVEEGLREFAPTAEIHFERVAVTLDQVEEWSLPTRPTKTSDSRSKGFEGGSVEVDAISPRRLRGLTREVIEQHVDHRQLDVLREAERSERSILMRLAREAA